MDDKAKVEVKDADRIERVAQLFEALHNKAAAIVVRTVGFCGTVHYAAADFLDLVSSKAAKAERDRIVEWLREIGLIHGGVADAIEAGEHLRGNNDPDLPNGKKCPKLPENESILPERVKRWRKEREAFVEAMREKENEDGQ